MNDHTPGHGSAAGTDLDPDIRRFVTSVSESWAQHPLDKLSRAEVRRIAEEVRAPWSQGGPVMIRSSEHRIPFGTARVRIRVYEPSDKPIGPALIYLHGGGWTYFSLDTHDRLMREYAYRAQVAVVGVDYSLSPEAKFPQALQETVAVVRWLRGYGETLGIDPQAMAIGGDSAGANLSIATALALREEGAGHVLRGMLLNYGAFDDSCDFPSYGAFDGPAYMLGRVEMAKFWGNYLAADADRANPLACPLRARLERLPPAFVGVADCDVLRDENLAMIDRLRESGVSVEAHLYRGAAHSFLEAVSISTLADRAFADAASWLKSVL